MDFLAQKQYKILQVVIHRT